MVTWENLDTGFSNTLTYISDHPYPLTSIWNARVVPAFVIDLAKNMADVLMFALEVFVILVIPVIVCAFIYHLFVPVVQNFGNP